MNIVKERINNNKYFEIGAWSIIGTREYQQDYAYFFEDEEEALLIVCDGMGGLEGGEIASSTAVRQLAEDFHKAGSPGDVPDFFLNAASHMNRAVLSLRNKKGQKLKAGTTLVAAYCRENEMYWVSVGDSRIYLIRGDKIVSINRDHNYRLALQSELQNGVIDQKTYDREEKTPQAEALISFIGIEDLRLVDVNRTPVKLVEGDIVILCSDGVYKSLSDGQVCALARDNDLDMNIAADRITQMALRYGMFAQDNTTVLMMRCRFSGDPKAD